MTLEACPKCGTDNIFVPLVPAVGYDGRLYGGRSEGFCNNLSCDQRFWYVPHSGRITRRNSGMTLKEYRLRHVDVDVFNIMRRHAGLPPVAKLPMGVLTIVDPDPERFGILGERWLARPARRAGRWLADWCAWFAAFWRVYRPWSFNKKGVSDG
jgi:hypothetical protein